MAPIDQTHARLPSRARDRPSAAAKLRTRVKLDDLAISSAIASDLDEILSLLTAVNLPHDGVSEQLASFIVMRNGDSRVVGCAGVERHGALGLLRSVAIDPQLQRSGVGQRLVAAALEYAGGSEIEEVVLLTTTARDFFAHRFGFTETTREPYDEPLAASAEWQLPRCSSAVVMSLRLSKGTPV